MVITVSCPSCGATFPVDTNKVPVGGVNARCSECRHVFRVERPVEPPSFPPEPLPTLEAPGFESGESDFSVGTGVAAEPEADAGRAWVFEREEPIEAGGLDIQPMDTVESAVEEARAAAVVEPAPPPPPAPPAPPRQPEAAPPPVSGFTFGKRDPSDKARRLARVLVSDMIMYNPERHERALAAGTLKQDFEEEIAKSWKEYVDQVGEQMATGNTFWADALNDVLAKGQKVF